jgi:hypothetical protein
MKNIKRNLSSRTLGFMLIGSLMMFAVPSFAQNHNPEFEISDVHLGGSDYVFIPPDAEATPFRTAVPLQYRDDNIPENGSTTLSWESGDKINVYQTGVTSALDLTQSPTWSDADQGDKSLELEAHLDAGEGDSQTLQAIYTNPDGGDSPVGEREFTLVKLDLDVDANYDGTIDDDDEADEASAGGLVFLNDDDDDQDGTPDKDQDGAVAGEDDLIEIKLSLDPDLGEGEVRLEVVSGSDNIKVWDDSTKTTEIDLSETWDLSSDTLPSSLFVEAIAESSSPRDVELILTYQPDDTLEITDSIVLTLLKVEIGSQAEEAYKNKYVYRGDPLWNWAQNSRDLDNAYTGQTNDIASHPTLGDYVHYKAYHPGLDSSLVTNYKWSAVPAGGYTNLTTIDGPDDSSASEWKIEDGGVDWKSGIYEITLELTLSGGATATVTKEQTVWQRTDDVLVVGYIDSEDFPNIPDGATSQPVLADGTVSPVTMEDHLSPLNRTGFFGQVYIGVYKTVFKPDAARHYLNRFILQETANADPPSNFQLQLSNGVFVYDEVEINNFFSNNLNYRAINRLQAEYLLDESGEILAGPNVITKIAYQTNVGNTPDFPWVLESFADLVPFDWVDSSSEPEIHPDSGVFNFDDSTYDFYHVEHSIGVPQGFAQYVSGRVGAKGQGMNLKINGRETPWIYGLIEFKGDVYGPEYSEIIRQIFPTYWIYVNGERVNNFPQSDPELFIQLGNSL